MIHPVLLRGCRLCGGKGGGGEHVTVWVLSLDLSWEKQGRH